MFSSNFFNKYENLEDEEIETFIKEKKRKRTDIDNLTENLNKIKIRKTQLLDFCYMEPTIRRIGIESNVEINKIKIDDIEDHFVSGCFIIHENIEVNWNMNIKVTKLNKTRNAIPNKNEYICVFDKKKGEYYSVCYKKNAIIYRKFVDEIELGFDKIIIG